MLNQFARPKPTDVRIMELRLYEAPGIQSVPANSSFPGTLVNF